MTQIRNSRGQIVANVPAIGRHRGEAHNITTLPLPAMGRHAASCECRRDVVCMVHTIAR